MAGLMMMNTFRATRLVGNARVADGKLILDGRGYLWAAKDAKQNADNR